MRPWAPGCNLHSTFGCRVTRWNSQEKAVFCVSSAWTAICFLFFLGFWHRVSDLKGPMKSGGQLVNLGRSCRNLQNSENCWFSYFEHFELLAWNWYWWKCDAFASFLASENLGSARPCPALVVSFDLGLLLWLFLAYLNWSKCCLRSSVSWTVLLRSHFYPSSSVCSLNVLLRGALSDRLVPSWNFLDWKTQTLTGAFDSW